MDVDARTKQASELALAGKDGEALALLRDPTSPPHRKPAAVDASLEELLLRFVAAGDWLTPRQLLFARYPDETAPIYEVFKPRHDQPPPIDTARLNELVARHPVDSHALLIALLWFRLQRPETLQALAHWRLGDGTDTAVVQTVVHESQARTQAIRELAHALPIDTPLRQLAPVGDGIHFDSTAGLVGTLLVSLIISIVWIQYCG